MELTAENFQKEVLESDKPVFVDFWAPWCGPCRIIGPIVEELSNEMPAVKFGKLNVDEHPGIATQYGIMSIPTMKVFKEGKVVKEFVGSGNTKDMLKAELSSL